MANDTEALLWISPIFVGLTRPPMLFGITLDYLGLSMMLVLCGFILASNPFILLLYLPLHVVGAVLCAIDPHIFRLLFKKCDCLNGPNQRFWRCQSYEPY